jgi:hypothetical protein
LGWVGLHQFKWCWRSARSGFGVRALAALLQVGVHPLAVEGVARVARPHEGDLERSGMLLGVGMEGPRPPCSAPPLRTAAFLTWRSGEAPSWENVKKKANLMIREDNTTPFRNRLRIVIFEISCGRTKTEAHIIALAPGSVLRLR